MANGRRFNVKLSQFA
jgi:hypothetical protein